MFIRIIINSLEAWGNEKSASLHPLKDYRGKWD